MGFVVIQAGVWELSVIVTELWLILWLDSYCVSEMMGFVVIPAGMWEQNVIVTEL